MILTLPMVYGSSCDPWQDTDRTHNLALIAELRTRWGKTDQPDDQLAIAHMALVNLALSGNPSNIGDRGGIWRQRARELGDMRQGRPASFHDRIPHLWVLALDGFAKALIDELDATPAATDDPHARALRCFATGDWRPLNKQPQKTAHEALALYLSSSCAGLEDDEINDVPARTVPDGLRGIVRPDHSNKYRPALSYLLIDASLLLLSPRLPQEQALPIVKRLATASQTDGESLPALAAAVRRLPTDPGVLQALWELCDVCRSGPRGVRAQDGKWILVGLGDWAVEVRQGLFIMLTCLPKSNQHRIFAPDILRKYLDTAPAGLPSSILRCRSAEDGSPAAQTALLDCLKVELDNQYLSPASMGGIVDSSPLLARRDELQKRCAEEYLRREPGRPAGWDALAITVMFHRYDREWRSAIPGLLAANPWMPNVYWQSRPRCLLDFDAANHFPWIPGFLRAAATNACMDMKWDEAYAGLSQAHRNGQSLKAIDMGWLLGEAASRTGHNDEALDVWRELAAGEGRIAWLSRGSLGLEAETRGDFSEADRWCRQGMDNRYANLEYNDEIIEYLMRRNRWDEAVSFAKERLPSSKVPGMPFMKSAVRTLRPDADAADLDAVVADLRQSKIQNLMRSIDDREVNDLLSCFLGLIAHQRYQDIIGMFTDDMVNASGTLKLIRAWTLLDSGDLAGAADTISRDIPQFYHPRLSPHLRLWNIALAKLTGRTGVIERLPARFPPRGFLPLCPLIEDVEAWQAGLLTLTQLNALLDARRPISARARHMLAMLLLADGHRDQALAQLQTLERMNGNLPETISLRKLLALHLPNPAAPDKPASANDF